MNAENGDRSPSNNLNRKANHLLDTNTRLNSPNALNTPGSSATRKLVYSQKEKTLEVELTTGRIYQYLPVPLSEWKRYKAHVDSGGSSGEFYNFEIKDKYDYREVLL